MKIKEGDWTNHSNLTFENIFNNKVINTVAERDDYSAVYSY